MPVRPPTGTAHTSRCGAPPALLQPERPAHVVRGLIGQEEGVRDSRKARERSPQGTRVPTTRGVTKMTSSEVLSVS
jgi:hypothetical protein